MQDFRIATVQATFAQANTVDDSVAIVETWVARAAAEKADLVVFGELCLSGYLLDSSHLDAGNGRPVVHYRRAEEVPGPAVRKLERIARRHGVFVGAGMADIEAGVVYNSYFLVGPEGYVGKQRKTHVPPVEYPYYGAASAYHVFDIGLCRIGVSICFDNWFPETSRILALMGADMVIAPFMWIVPPGSSETEKQQAAERRRDKHMKIFPARALDNAMYFVVVDHVGVEAEDFELPGVSMAFGPNGDVIAQSRPFTEEMVLVDVKKSELERSRTYGQHNTLRYRRPKIYSRLVQPAE